MTTETTIQKAFLPKLCKRVSSCIAGVTLNKGNTVIMDDIYNGGLLIVEDNITLHRNAGRVMIVIFYRYSFLFALFYSFLVPVA